MVSFFVGTGTAEAPTGVPTAVTTAFWGQAPLKYQLTHGDSYRNIFKINYKNSIKTIYFLI